MLYIGIDTGTHTGLAVWDSEAKAFQVIDTMMLHEALFNIKNLWDGRKDIRVVFEDARQRKWYDTRSARQDRARLQGAGSIKRDCNIWEEFLKDYKIPYEAVPPCRNVTKTTAESFARLTKWHERTSEHSRDAAMLVWRKTPIRSFLEQAIISNRKRK